MRFCLKALSSLQCRMPLIAITGLWLPTRIMGALEIDNVSLVPGWQRILRLFMQGVYNGKGSFDLFQYLNEFA